MIYENIKPAKFLSRPNRFIAYIELEDSVELCHVKNTGRCKELLIPNSKILVQEHMGTKRKTNYDLISVYKGDRLVNIDSQIPNKVFHEWLGYSNYFGELRKIKPEYSYRNSRFDFYLEGKQDKILVEVKGVTLEENGIVLFPDAPTQRGVKHINDLCSWAAEGNTSCLVFIIQMSDVQYFTPNNKTHQAFGEALKLAKSNGVQIFALDCTVTENSITAKDFVEIIL